MIYPAPDERVDPKEPPSWIITKIGAGSSYLRIEKLRSETLVFLCLTTAPYEEQHSGEGPISATEFEELAGLRKAKGWGTAIFQPGHPRYAGTMARMAELEAKERAMAWDEIGEVPVTLTSLPRLPEA
jgi:hypothetical protein